MAISMDLGFMIDFLFASNDEQDYGQNNHAKSKRHCAKRNPTCKC